jgi:hypothetical protein
MQSLVSNQYYWCKRSRRSAIEIGLYVEGKGMRLMFGGYISIEKIYFVQLNPIKYECWTKATTKLST